MATAKEGPKPISSSDKLVYAATPSGTVSDVPKTSADSGVPEAYFKIGSSLVLKEDYYKQQEYERQEAKRNPTITTYTLPTGETTTNQAVAENYVATQKKNMVSPGTSTSALVAQTGLPTPEAKPTQMAAQPYTVTVGDQSAKLSPALTQKFYEETKGGSTLRTDYQGEITSLPVGKVEKEVISRPTISALPSYGVSAKQVAESQKPSIIPANIRDVYETALITPGEIDKGIMESGGLYSQAVKKAEFVLNAPEYQVLRSGPFTGTATPSIQKATQEFGAGAFEGIAEKPLQTGISFVIAAEGGAAFGTARGVLGTAASLSGKTVGAAGLAAAATDVGLGGLFLYSEAQKYGAAESAKEKGKLFAEDVVSFAGFGVGAAAGTKLSEGFLPAAKEGKIIGTATGKTIFYESGVQKSNIEQNMFQIRSTRTGDVIARDIESVGTFGTKAAMGKSQVIVSEKVPELGVTLLSKQEVVTGMIDKPRLEGFAKAKLTDTTYAITREGPKVTTTKAEGTVDILGINKGKVAFVSEFPSLKYKEFGVEEVKVEAKMGKGTDKILLKESEVSSPKGRTERYITSATERTTTLEPIEIQFPGEKTQFIGRSTTKTEFTTVAGEDFTTTLQPRVSGKEPVGMPELEVVKLKPKDTEVNKILEFSAEEPTTIRKTSFKMPSSTPTETILTAPQRESVLTQFPGLKNVPTMVTPTKLVSGVSPVLTGIKVEYPFIAPAEDIPTTSLTTATTITLMDVKYPTPSFKYPTTEPIIKTKIERGKTALDVGVSTSKALTQDTVGLITTAQDTGLTTDIITSQSIIQTPALKIDLGTRQDTSSITDIITTITPETKTPLIPTFNIPASGRPYASFKLPALGGFGQPAKGYKLTERRRPRKTMYVPSLTATAQSLTATKARTRTKDLLGIEIRPFIVNKKRSKKR